MNSVSVENSKNVSVDDIHDEVDKLILTVFETMRDGEARTGQTSADSAVAVQTIMTQYDLLQKMIGELPGVDYTGNQLDQMIKEVSEEMEVRKANIFQLEQSLIEEKGTIQAQIIELTTNEKLSIDIIES